MKFRSCRTVLVCAVICMVAGGCRRQANSTARADQPPAPTASRDAQATRRTPLVELYEKCSNAVVNIHTIKQVDTEDGPAYQSSWGSGWLLHSAGYIVTAEHAVKADGRRMVILPGPKHYDARVIVRYPPLDIALLKIDSDQPFDVLKVGRSNDLMVGELAATIGNPTGLWDTFSVGIITGLGRISGAADSYIYGMIQTDAGINHGNSGGPLINALGEVIGVVDGMKGEAENIGFAVAIDQLRANFSDMISAEQRFGFILGLEVDTMGSDARVTSVAPDSPAAEAGLATGDVITQVGEMKVRHGLDFYLALLDRAAGEELVISRTRNGEAIDVSVTLTALPLRLSLQAEPLTEGLTYEAFIGQWDKLPEFDELSAVKIGQVDTVRLPDFNDTATGVGLRLTGYLAIPTDGLYTFLLTSDDGSKLYIGKNMLIDNDGMHKPQVQQGLVRLQAGLHPITVLYFDRGRGGGKALGLTIEGPDMERQSVPASMCFTSTPVWQSEIIDVPNEIPAAGD